VPRAARLFAEVASALDHAHHQGLIHRDLKPSNVLITPNDHAKLLDLGLAISQGEQGLAREIIGGAGYVVGTMDYISPEQAEDASSVDPRSDIYGLGCTLYYALTGRPPFPGGTTAEKLQRHRHEDPTPIPQLNPAVPPAFIGVLRRMTAKSPAQRYPTAAALRDDLLKWADGEAALPLDRPDDSAYKHAVAELAAAEPDSELEAEVIPVGIPEPAPRRPKETAAETWAEIAATAPARPPQRRNRPLPLPGTVPPPRPSGPPLLLYLLLAGLVLFFLAGGSLAALLYLLLKH
jgi:eukaryotic-like serine/threonine-protein kinase